ncbi:MAG: hypothetical protein IT319_02200 [Anaerolineae bacterium]|nr:hypothetical protein [Anaerolineae bacterium]
MDKTAVLDESFQVPKPIIGMVHLRPLPGAPLYDPRQMNMEAVIAVAVDSGGFELSRFVDGLQIENIWDFPYLKSSEVGHETTAALAVAAREVKNAVHVPIDINCHLNAGIQALSVAAAGWASRAASPSTGRMVVPFPTCLVNSKYSARAI